MFTKNKISHLIYRNSYALVLKKKEKQLKIAFYIISQMF